LEVVVFNDNSDVFQMAIMETELLLQLASVAQFSSHQNWNFVICHFRKVMPVTLNGGMRMPSWYAVLFLLFINFWYHMYW